MGSELKAHNNRESIEIHTELKLRLYGACKVQALENQQADEQQTTKHRVTSRG